MGREFEARYSGICAACDEEFPVGDVIRYEGSDVVHVTCPDAALTTRPEPPVCPSCWTVHVGECL